jgi:hypothetical protein
LANRYSVSQMVREMQIKTIMTYYFILISIIKKLKNNKGWWGTREKGSFYTLVLEM